jgi:hypothetical protein
MAEALVVVGIVASIVQLVDFSTRVVSRLDEFYSVAKEVPKSFRHVKTELPLLATTLAQLQGAISTTLVANKSHPAHERSDREKAEAIVTKLRHLLELAQASMAEVQQEQERQANGHRREAPQLRIGDKVWLKLGKQFATGQNSKKLDWRSAKYTVTEVIDTHTVRLNTPPGPHNVFHVDRLRLASSDPLPSQLRDDDQPLPIQVDNDGADMWEVEDIVAEVCRRRGRGIRWWYEVKWKGYHLPTMEPMENLANTEAKIRWEQFTVPYRDPNTRLLPAGFRRGSNQTHPDVSGKEGVM